MKYKLFISDFDGTMGVAPDHIEKETVESIKEYQQKGGIFVICTGRSYLSIKNVCEKYGIKGIAIAFQGSLACDLSENKIIFNGGMDNTLTARVVQDLLDFGIETGVYLDDLFYYGKRTPAIAEYERLVTVNGVSVDNLIEFINTTDKKVRKILSIGKNEELNRVLEILSKKYGDEIIVNRSAKTLLEVISPKWSKREAVVRIAKHYNIPLSSVLTAGDSTNDIGLLDGQWHGVAVGDAMEELKKYAKEVTVPFKEQPIKFLLEKYCL